MCPATHHGNSECAPEKLRQFCFVSALGRLVSNLKPCGEPGVKIGVEGLEVFREEGFPPGVLAVAQAVVSCGGSDVDWLRNVMAAGGGVMRWQGRAHPFGMPEPVDSKKAMPLFPLPLRLILRLNNTEEFVFVRSKKIAPSP